MTMEEKLGWWMEYIDIPLMQMTLEKVGRHSRQSGMPFCPKPKDTFNAFEHCDPLCLRGVIVGQDPYAQFGVATGIAFANRPEIPEKEQSSSLKVLRKCAESLEAKDETRTFDPTFLWWEQQGILMLNSSLTVTENFPGSHARIWRPFMESFLSSLSKAKKGIPWVLLGSQAQELKPFIQGRQFVIEEKHPSWYARKKEDMPAEWLRDMRNLILDYRGYEFRILKPLNKKEEQ